MLFVFLLTPAFQGTRRTTAMNGHERSSWLFVEIYSCDISRTYRTADLTRKYDSALIRHLIIEPMIDNTKVTIIRSCKGKFKLEFTIRKFLFLRDLRRDVRNTVIVFRGTSRHALFPRDRVLFFWLLQIVSTRPHDAQLRNDQPKHVVFRTAVAMRVMYRL